MMYIYIRDNEWFKSLDVYKVGITTDINNRKSTYITGEIKKGSFPKIIKLLNIINDELIIIDKKIKDKFKYLNVYYEGGGTEFYKREIINNYIENYLIENNYEFEIVNENDIDNTNKKEIDNDNKNDKDVKNDKDEIEEVKNEIKLRDYQIEAIEYMKKELIENGRIYLYLATGAGKSLISINVIKEIKPLNIIIFSPRTIIREQNIKKDNLNILNNYNENYKNGENKNLIISSCIHSYKNIYDLIIKNDIREIFIWFDEAHWGLDKWILETDDKIKQFFLNDNNYIKNRLFTTASPNKEFVIDNSKIYGKLYEPIKFKELLNRKFLSDIYVEIFDKEIDKEKIHYNNLIFNTFNKKGSERKLGFSFHNSCDSARIYYEQHRIEYDKKNIDIKPYLLISEKTDDENNSIINFENEIKNNQKAIAYVVAKFSIGYDNKNIDIIYFTDPKLSYKDIIQSIGRGTRINNNKNLRIVLPTNKENGIDYDYKKIENVLKYLLLDIELEPDKIKSYNLIDKSSNFIMNDNDNNNNNDDNRREIEEDNNEKSNINTIKFNIISKLNDWTINKIIHQLKRNNIHNKEDYEEYQKNNKNLNLPDIKILLNDKDFNFRDTYRNENECPFYYYKNDCLEIIKKYKNELRKINIDNKKLKLLNEKDIRIPKMPLYHFYGGSKEDYF